MPHGKPAQPRQVECHVFATKTRVGRISFRWLPFLSRGIEWTARMQRKGYDAHIESVRSFCVVQFGGVRRFRCGAN